MTIDLLVDHFRRYARTKLADDLAQIERCLSVLSVEQVWHRPNTASNAIGNLILHLRGNVGQWILAGLAEEAFVRDRPAEFASHEPLSPEQIFGELRRTVEQAQQVIADLTAEEMAQPFDIQGYQVSGLEAVFHVVEHFARHTGQIIYATKLLTGEPLKLYDEQGRRLDGRTSDVP